jgi:ABC-type transport system substrate-binding protein
MASSSYDKGRLIDAPDATFKKLRESWIGTVSLLSNITGISNKVRRQFVQNEFGPGPYKFLRNDLTLVPLWLRNQPPFVPLENEGGTVGPNQFNIRVDLTEAEDARPGGRWQFMKGDTSDPRVRQILNSPLTSENSLVLFTKLEKKRDANNRSAYRNVARPVPGEFLTLYNVHDTDAAPIDVEVVIERIKDQRYIVVEL